MISKENSRSSCQNVDKVKEITLKNPHYNLRELARELNISHQKFSSLTIMFVGTTSRHPSVIMVNEFSVKNSIKINDQASYSPDLVPAD